MSGSLQQVVQNLDDLGDSHWSCEVRRNVARSFAFQAFSELHVLHTFAHHHQFSASLKNTVVTAEGGLATNYFGGGLSYAAQSLTVGENGRWRSRGACNDAERSGDILAVWGAVLQVLAGFADVEKKTDASEKQSHFAQDVVRSFGQPTCAAPYLERAIRHDPQLVDLALHSGMRAGVKQRDAAIAQARRAAALLATIPAEERVRLREFFAVNGEKTGAAHRF